MIDEESPPRDTAEITSTEDRERGATSKHIALPWPKGDPGATYVRIARIEVAAIGRLWNIILEDGRHLAGIFNHELRGDSKEASCLRLDFRAHDIAVGSAEHWGPTPTRTVTPLDDPARHMLQRQLVDSLRNALEVLGADEEIPPLPPDSPLGESLAHKATRASRDRNRAREDARAALKAAEAAR